MTATKLYPFPQARALAQRRMAPVRLVALLAFLLSAPIAAGAQDRAGLPSPSSAFAMSLFGTVVPVAAGVSMLAGDTPAGIVPMAFGVIFGPSLGYWYSGQKGRGWKGLGLRVVTAGAFVGAAAMCFADWGDSCSRGNAGAATALILAGAAFTIGSAVIDIAEVWGSVKRRNAQAGWAVSVAPLIRPAAHAGGLLFSFSF